ncbi:MAG: 1-acyl-sn-glycerol-3-phosphate acyltransferase [Planctomycetes bacterium]|nr:1-acyl-sn-glycerol-3-phosphate acyltransferase [Planctomycetota bacterium]
MSVEASFVWRLLRFVTRPLATLLFDLKVDGSHHVPDRPGVLIVANHQSVLDSILLTLRVERPLSYLAKSELFENRFVGWLLRTVFNAFPVRLGRGDVGAIKETIQRLRDGHLMSLYPEGARTRDGRIGPLQKGVALIVQRAEVAVVPAVIAGAFEAWPIDRRFPRRHPIDIRFGPPLDLAGLDREEIVALIDDTLRSMFATLQEERAASRERRAT